jgi:SAM-dependent methyltransferase
MSWPDLPSPERSRQQAGWLGAARSRLLRRAEIATRRRVLDLGCGHVIVAAELQRRTGGRIVAVDCRREALRGPDWPPGVPALCADGHRLPFTDRSFDLVFCQWTMLWLRRPDRVIAEVGRVLLPGGHFLLIEPDFGGLVEYPPAIATRELWLDGLSRAGADPLVGRRLPGLLTAAGFEVRVDLLDRLLAPSPLRLELLGELPLSEDERALLAAAARADAQLEPAARVAHLPMFLVTARKPACPG